MATLAGLQGTRLGSHAVAQGVAQGVVQGALSEAHPRLRDEAALLTL